jgi:glycosyltransferase involved in cell wall biosynthesis
MKHEPLISVIIPTNNEAERLDLTLKSMSAQTYKHLEILVIDDHSTDSTKELVLAWQKKDARFHYHLLPYEDKKRTHILPHRTQWFRRYDINGGYLARNYGFEIAKGDYITIQDGDDASLANRIEVQYQLATRYNASLIATQWMPLNPSFIFKSLDIERLFLESDPSELILPPKMITEIAAKNKGFLMNDRFPHAYIPFFFKWFPLTRPLFFSGVDAYPGADNSFFFKREVIEMISFRKRDDRVWPTPYGRGSGRDFGFHVAEVLKNSWTFQLPLYLWRTSSPHTELCIYEKYLV